MNAIATPSGLRGTGLLLRLYARQDRIGLPSWVLALFGLTLATAVAFEEMLAAEGALTGFAQSIAVNPGLQALVGPVFESGTIGGLTAWRVTAFVGILAGVMNAVFVVRHTRAEEESGRAELVGAGAVGRYAAPVAALIVVLGADLLLVVLVGAGLTAFGLPAAGAFALGAAFGACGAVFAAVAAIAAQLFGTARAATGSTLAVVAAAYLARAAGDSGTSGLSWLSWSSPIGWAQQQRSFADERWWVLALPITTAVVLTGVAFALASVRNAGSGMLPQRRGRERATATLSGPFGLAFRLQRGGLIGWLVAMAVFGGVIGAVAVSMLDILEDNPALAEIFRAMGGSDELLLDTYFTSVFGMFAFAAAAFAVGTALQARTEETESRADPVLAGAVRRWQWLGGHALVAVTGTVLVMSGAGAAMGVTYGASVGDISGQMQRLAGAGLVQVPAALVLGGVAVLLLGWTPRFATSAWAVFGAAVGIVFVADLLELPGWVGSLSPFSHTPSAPAADVSVMPLGVMVLVSLTLAVVGLLGVRRRDIG